MPPDSNLIEHYKNYFSMLKAESPEQREIAFHIRYRVYFEEQNMISADSLGGKFESDTWDPCSIHSLLYHKPSCQPIGNVRLIPLDRSPTRTLPMEEHYHLPFDFSGAPIRNIRFGKTAEVSRMLILSSFRRRKGDLDYTYETEQTSAGGDDKRFPVNYLPVCMIFATAVLMLEEQLDYGVALMEPRLARLLGRFGVGLHKIGEAMDYFGPRAPYLIFPEPIYDSVDAEYKALYDVIRSELVG